MDENKLKEILNKHKAWLCGEDGGEQADLSGANLSRADLVGADLSGADLSRAKNLFLPIACPDTGEFTAWKKCAGSTIVKLLIPADAKRSSATSRKCRASKAVVIAVYDKDDNEIDRAVSIFSNTFVYHKGKTVEPANGFDDNRWNECAPGIHFFITREEAENY